MDAQVDQLARLIQLVQVGQVSFETREAKGAIPLCRPGNTTGRRATGKNRSKGFSCVCQILLPRVM
jgi:hypothetical protein